MKSSVSQWAVAAVGLMSQADPALEYESELLSSSSWLCVKAAPCAHRRATTTVPLDPDPMTAFPFPCFSCVFVL